MQPSSVCNLVAGLRRYAEPDENTDFHVLGHNYPVESAGEPDRVNSSSHSLLCAQISMNGARSVSPLEALKPIPIQALNEMKQKNQRITGFRERLPTDIA
ncbi:hypothetical protein SCP_0902640 [Sparassis crispa]|uniref:Uncharacterized protein n=1 Tax=Sparassis crispa TaxID=139825 RepID=A0A401GVZ3_9APHY|nr:hypothetical protein SCP_0902640 [Sparassis crispa]GBE86385.1 hypothetical protein SCP_0902640 [Sparassis crispa]